MTCINKHANKWQIIGNEIKSGLPDLDRHRIFGQFVGLENIHLITRLNYEAFEKSLYSASYEKFYERNLSIIKRNNKCFFLILSPSDKSTIIGYTAYFPLTTNGLKTYLNGEFSDAEFPIEFISGNSEDVAGALMFEINLLGNYSLAKSGAHRQHTTYFLDCNKFHMSVFRKNNGKIPNLYAQTEIGGIERKLRLMGFNSLNKKSKEGLNFYYLNSERLID